MLNTNLNSFVNIEAKSGGMTQKKYDDNWEEESDHGGVSSVVVGDGVVQGGSSEMVEIRFNLEAHVFNFPAVICWMRSNYVWIKIKETNTKTKAKPKTNTKTNINNNANTQAWDWDYE